MPIRKQQRQYYGREWRLLIRPRILERARHCCERCGVPNRVVVKRCGGGFWFKVSATSWEPGPVGTSKIRTWVDEAGQPAKKPRGQVVRTVRIILAVCHRNHQSGDDREENLAAWCQWCHLKHDREQHRETRGDRKDSTRPLLSIARNHEVIRLD